MPTKRLNYTERTDLQSRHVTIKLSPKTDGASRTFEVETDLPKGLPQEASVVLEAYRATPPARMRFDLGTVGYQRELTEDQRALSAFADDLPPPSFRLKVVGSGDEHGRLLADARRIKVFDPSEKPETRQGMLFIHHKPLDGLAWDLDPTNTPYEPTLWIDSDADPSRELARDERFIALVYPEVCRRVLEHLLIVEEGAAADDEESWGHAWITMASRLPAMAGDPCPLERADTDEDRRDWIGRATRAFGASIDVCRLLVPEEGDDA